MVACLGLRRRDIAKRLQEPSVAEPADPFEGRQFDGLEAASRPAPVDDLGLVEAVDGLGEGIVVAVSNATDRRLDVGPGQTLGVFDREVFHTPIGMVDEANAVQRTALMKRLLERIENKAGVGRATDPPAADPPADDPLGKGVDDEGDIDEAGPGPSRVTAVGAPHHSLCRRETAPTDAMMRTAPIHCDPLSTSPRKMNAAAMPKTGMSVR